MKLGIFCNVSHEELKAHYSDLLVTINEALLQGDQVFYILTSKVVDIHNTPADKLSSLKPEEIYLNKLASSPVRIDLFELEAFMIRDTEDLLSKKNVFDRLDALARHRFFLDDPLSYFNMEDKVKQNELLGDCPTPKTYVLYREQTEKQRESGIELILGQESFPLVVKGNCGCGGREVFKADSPEGLKEFIARIFHDTDALLIQEFIPETYQGDKRVIILGGEFLVSYSRIPKPGEWRTNVTQGARLAPYQATPVEIATAKKIAQRSGLNLLSVDYIRDKVIEFNTSPGFEHDANKAWSEKIQCQKKLIEYIKQKANRFYQNRF